MERYIIQDDTDGQNIQLQFFNILKHLVVRERSVELIQDAQMDHSMYYYRNKIYHMIANGKSSLPIKYNHIIYVDETLAELIFFRYYRVSKLLTIKV